jgi:hypothetical protein
MKKPDLSSLPAICLPWCFCAAALTATAPVHAVPATNTIQACYNKTNGELRRVNSPADCRNHETAISWGVAGPAGPQGPVGPQGPEGPQGPAGPGGANVEVFRHTRTVGNECVSPAPATFSVVDHLSLNGNADAMIFVTALIGINDLRTNNNPNSNLLVVYTGGAVFGGCPAGRWIIGGGDVTTGAQFNVMVVSP